ncbi:DUF202 domain-containing protein [Nakamurella endophytica]|uniref:DUF202 domain-containing protein n=1 Tax=Nakamurella endophytica TaxID=1748367 RepID=A0A917WBT4_9ACTN|nr:DUF202 domain-containing protein [Nakamurella endophytica]GGL87978.1 hypothetical protein GCM10011594_04510 [Nakamurella endophytica]
MTGGRSPEEPTAEAGHGAGAGRAADHPFDRGLQPERTALAWRRTALALTVGALAGLRILPQLFGTWAVIAAGAGVVLSVAVLVAAHRRYRASHRGLTAGRLGSSLPDGVLPAVTAGLALAAALAGIAVAVAAAGAGGLLHR